MDKIQVSTVFIEGYKTTVYSIHFYKKEDAEAFAVTLDECVEECRASFPVDRRLHNHAWQDIIDKYFDDKKFSVTDMCCIVNGAGLHVKPSICQEEIIIY